MGVQMSTPEVSSDDEDEDDNNSQPSNSSKSDKDEDINNLPHIQDPIIRQPSVNHLASMSTVEYGPSPSHESPSLHKPQNQPPPPPPPPSRKQKHQSPQSLPESSLLNAAIVDSGTVDAEAEKNKKLLEWELSTLEADDLRSHAWYHGQQIDRTEAERLLRQCVAEEHSFSTTTIITENTNNNDTNTSPNNATVTASTGSSSLQQNVKEDSSDTDGTEDISSESSDVDIAFDDFSNKLVDENGVVLDPSVATSTEIAAALQLKQRRRLHGELQTKRSKRPRRHYYCFLVRDSLNVRPPGRYVMSCLRVDKYEDLEIGDRYKTDEQRRKVFRQQQRRHRRQNVHPVLHFVVNEIILQPGTVYERSQFSFGETLPSLTSGISTAVVNSNVGHNEQQRYQPGFDSVPDLIRYYVGGADDNAMLFYGGGNDGIMTFARTQQTEVRIRYPCNRRRPLMTDNMMVEVATPNILPDMIENSRLVRQRCNALTATSANTERLRLLSTSPSGSTEASTSSQNMNHLRHSPSPPPYTSKWMRVQSSYRPSVRNTPSATVTSTKVTSITSLENSPSARSVKQSQSQPFSYYPPRIDPRLSNTSISTLPRQSRSPQDLKKTFPSRFKPGDASTSVQTLPRQPKSSFPLPSTSGSSSVSEHPSSSGSKLISDQLRHTPSYSGMTSTNTPNLTISDLLSSPSSSSKDSSRSLQSTSSRNNSINDEFTESPFRVFSVTAMGTNEDASALAVDIDAPGTSSSNREMFNEHAVDLFSLPFQNVVTSSFIRVRVRNGYRNMLNKTARPSHLNQLRRSPNMSIPDSHYPRSHSFRGRSASYRNQSGRPQTARSNSTIQSSSGNDDDDDEQQQSSSSESSSVSTSTLKNENIERNKSKQRQYIDQEVENQTNSIEKCANINQTLSSDEQTTPHPVLNTENSPSEISENKNFQKCRTRWTNSMRQGLVNMLERPHPDHQHRQLTQITGTSNRDPRQRGSRQIHQAPTEDQKVDNIAKRIKFKPSMSTDRAATLGPIALPQTHTTCCSIRSSNNDLSKNMIRQWVGLQRISNQNNNSDVVEVYNKGGIPLVAILSRIRRQRWQRRQSNKFVIASGDHFSTAEKCHKRHVSPSKEIQLSVRKNINYPQVNRLLPGFSIINQEGEVTSVVKVDQLNTNATFSEMNCPLTTTTECSTGISGQEIGTCSVGVGSIGCKLDCDYVNIDPHIEDHNNSVDKGDTKHHNINFLKNIYHGKKHQVSKQQSNDNCISLVDNNIEVSVDYENVISHNTDLSYENIDQISDKRQQKLINDLNGGNTAVADALRAVHLAIIGDPDDTGRTTVGTGKLAAALCRADGQATILPYRHNFTEGEQADPLLSTCPLQLLSQPGPAGRRARLDVIERFACLQYLVTMTVIVTPCLLLIGNDSDKENLADVNLEWSLEDEYEYRRQRFYYRCAGFSSWCVSDNDSTSDDDDESYKLTANSDFDSGYSLPPREEWAVEKRHWLDLLTRHRAAALDKWIRTAADAKQAVGDVYGYRALMSALCSDRIQALHDAWATLRRLHTATAVTFESRLRPEFLGRREKNVVTVLGTNDIEDNEVNELLQLPPNATIPDATALAVLYEHLYNDNTSDVGGMNNSAASSNDIGNKKEKDPRLSSFFTSPLLLSPSPWLSLNSGISGGLGSSVGYDYGLSALHILCIQYSDWVQQNNSDDDSILPSMKSPMLQLDRFRSNFRALLRQYSGDGFGDYDDNDVRFNYVPSDYKDVNLYKEKNSSYREEFNYNRNDEFAYERQYEDNVEEYGTSGGDNDDCGDDDEDDDATVICCNNSSYLSLMRNDAVNTLSGGPHVAAKAENQQKTTTKNEKYIHLKKHQEEDLYDRWIEDASGYGQGPAPLNIVFCTELHVRLFWPPTLFLQDINDDKDIIDHKSAIPAYALGTTYVATATAAFNHEDKSTNHLLPPLTLDHIIMAQLDQAAQDMRLRYKAMDEFLDRACAYSTSVAKMVY
ncbi:uncharacterized protein LOC112595762 [Melanaphis sacchari]|uniref:uncharacterized protein LOC112595762 n=1 Tax=Melanaphis sacchari TaxID=742174 RepID=UPI000DC1483C|nr:uncharacterized protein LOC112595762 [Melanaphis sacchari]